MKKSEIIDFCNQNSLTYVTDSTNLETEYTRNRIRADIIPVLEQLFGEPQRSGARLSAAAREDAEFILSQAQGFLDNIQGNGIPADKFNALHISLKKRVIMLSYAKVSHQSLEAIHISDIITLAQKCVPHSRISLPGNIWATIEDGCLVFIKPTQTTNADYNIKLSIGINEIPTGDFLICISESNCVDEMLKHGENVYKLYTSAYIKNATILSLSARPRKEGDTITDNKVNKKIKKLLCDKKIPLSVRNTIPLILLEDEIIYVPACTLADKVRATKKQFEYTISIYTINKEIHHE